jgi:AcrR family transcriptional regulator
MKPTSTDPRALRTRKLLREALMQVVIDKPFRDLTIRDITQSAGINRATFYLHYEDKYALLEDCAIQLFSKIRGAVESEFGLTPDVFSPVPFVDHGNRMSVVLQHIQDHSGFYKAMFAKDGDPLFYNMFRDNASIWIRSQLKDMLASQNKAVDEDFIEMMMRFQSAGNFDVISWWLENDMRIPIDVMSKRLAMITMPPMIRFLQGDAPNPCDSDVES